MAPDIAIVFPRATNGGGVERVALELLKHENRRRSAHFVGEQIDDSTLPHTIVAVPPVARALRPWAFRRASARRLRTLGARTVLSFGANCAPGDVYWVQSVHAAWLADGGEIRLRGVKIPPAARRLLLRHQVLLRLERDYFRNHRPRAIICTSQRESDDLVRYYSVPRDLLHVIPNGYDAGTFSAARAGAMRASAREQMNISADQRALLIVANEWHRKGLGPLLEAVAQLGDPSVHLHLVGKRSPQDYLSRATRLGLAERMHWHGPASDVARFYAAADVFVLPTTYEPFGLVIIEAMASGLPVVASRLAGASAAIRDGVSGFLLDDPRDVQELAGALRRALASGSELRSAAIEAARPYEWSQVFARVDELLFPTA